ncbi:MAG TPA: MFS transporter, partial [Paraburkholderia sp.]|nr:MFS transporter [Paraburkholderia sp.]
MLGTSIVATVVAHHYRDVVTRTINVLGAPAAAQWRPRFVDLRILIDDALRLKLIADMKPSGIDPLVLIDTARDALVQSIHIGVWLTAVAALAAALLVQRISHVVFNRS